MRDSCPCLKDLIDGGEDDTSRFQLPLHYLIRHLWSVRRAKPNVLFDKDVVDDFTSTLQKALGSVADMPDQDDANGSAQD
jgi:hypothetical protein